MRASLAQASRSRQGGNTVQQTTSAGAGSFTFNNVAAGTYQVDVAPPAGFEVAQALPADVVVVAGQAASLTLRLRRPVVEEGIISGLVSVSGQGLQGAVITLSGGPSVPALVTTSNSGLYSFVDLDAGNYSVQITPPDGFMLAQGENMSKSVTVVAGQGASVDFSLVLTAPGPVIEISLTSGPFRFVGPAGNAASGESVENLPRGATVRWTNTDNTFHTVTPEGHTEFAGAMTNAPGTVLEHVFLNPGEFAYFCQPHRGAGMTGRIVVQ